MHKDLLQEFATDRLNAQVAELLTPALCPRFLRGVMDDEASFELIVEHIKEGAEDCPVLEACKEWIRHEIRGDQGYTRAIQRQ